MTNHSLSAAIFFAIASASPLLAENNADQLGGDHDAKPAAAAHDESVTLPVAALGRFGIATEAVKAQVVAEPILSPGWAIYDPDGEALAVTPAAGRVTRLAVGLGSLVAAGDILAEITSPVFVEAQNSYILKRAASMTAALAVEQAQRSVDRGQQTGDGLSLAEQDRRASELRLAQVAMKAAQAEVVAAANTLRLLAGKGLDLEKLAADGMASVTLTIRAPASGTIVDRGAVLGQQVTPEGVPLFTLADIFRLWVVVQIPEALLKGVYTGNPVELTGFNGERLAHGVITHLTPEIDPHTRTSRARVRVQGAHTLRPGMYVQAAIIPGDAANAAPVLAVPESALTVFEGKSVVFLETRQGDSAVYRPRPVNVGPVQGGYVPVLSGLIAGDIVVVNGTFLLKADLGKEGAAHED